MVEYLPPKKKSKKLPAILIIGMNRIIVLKAKDGKILKDFHQIDIHLVKMVNSVTLEIISYVSLCDYYGLTPISKLCWDFENVHISSDSLNLTSYLKHSDVVSLILFKLTLASNCH